jgi:hypothetical protein
MPRSSNWFGLNRTPRRPAGRRRYRPAVEALDRRDLPAAFFSAGADIQTLRDAVFPGIFNPGGVLTGSVTVTPVPVNATAGQSFSGVIGTVFDRFADPQGRHLNAVIDWGDGSFLDVVRLQPAGNGLFNIVGTHVYRQSGTTTIAVWVQDVRTGWTASTEVPVAVADTLPDAPPPPPAAPPPGNAETLLKRVIRVNNAPALTDALGFWDFSRHGRNRFRQGLGFRHAMVFAR